MGRVINVGEAAYSGSDFAPIPHGSKLRATVFAIEEVKVKSGENAGKDQLDLTFKIQQDFPYTDENGKSYNAKGREIRFQKIPLYDSKAAWKLVSFAEAVGWPTKPSVELPDNLQSVLGSELIIKINEDAPNAKNQIYNSVGGYAKADGVTSTVSAEAAAPSWGALNS